MPDEESVSKIAEARRHEARDRLNSDLGQSFRDELLREDSVAAKARRDAVLASLLSLGCALALLVAGLVVVDQEAFSGRTKYGRPVDLGGKQAIGMGILFISFASVFVGLAVKPFKKRVAIFFAGLGLAGLCSALGMLLLR